MRISKEDADLFFRLMWELQFYVNQQLAIIPDVNSVEQYTQLDGHERLEVRDALWEHPELIEAYVEENPHNLPAAELTMVEQWEQFVSGTFYVYRFLKKHTIFIGEEEIYGVLSLYDPLEDMLDESLLPIMVQAVLLPFKGKVIYDGLLRSYPTIFGSGIRSNLHEDYMAAKQNGRIVTTFDREAQRDKRKRKKETNKEWLPLLEQIVMQTETMRGGPAIQSSALSLLRASGRIAQAAVEDPEDLDHLWALEVQVRKALTRFQHALERAER